MKIAAFILCAVIIALPLFLLPVSASSEPSPSPEPTAYIDADYEVQVLTTLGSIQAYLLFIVVVIMLYFTYKFFRMFF
jgi:hypothetical protein